MSRAGAPSRAGPWWRTPRQRQLAMRLTPAAAVLVPLRLQIGDMGDAGFGAALQKGSPPAVVEPTGSAGFERRRMTSISVNEFSTIAIARPGSAAIFASASIAILAADTMSLKAAAARWWAEIISRVIDCSAPLQPVDGNNRPQDRGRTTGTEAAAARMIPRGSRA